MREREKCKQRAPVSRFIFPDNTSNVYEGSVKLGSVLTETIKSDYNIEPELKQTQDDGSSILILKKATVPAVLIECGYMDNPADMKYLQDEKNQEKIARDILEAIKKYSLATAIPATETSPTNTGKQNKLVTQTSNTEINNEVVTENQVRNTSLTTNVSAEIAVTTISEVNETASDSSGPLKKVEVDADYPGDAKGWQGLSRQKFKISPGSSKQRSTGRSDRRICSEYRRIHFKSTCHQRTERTAPRICEGCKGKWLLGSCHE